MGKYWVLGWEEPSRECLALVREVLLLSCEVLGCDVQGWEVLGAWSGGA